jgi:hypothetical protein
MKDNFMKIPRSPRRARRQRGNEIIEFAVLSIFLVPLFIWMFVNGMNLLRFVQTSQINRDIGALYIHGVDFSTYEAQQVAARLAQGYVLNIGSSYVGSNPSNDANGGNAWVVLSQVMYVGATSCAALPNTVTCTNLNKYVFLQRLDFGSNSIQFNNVTVQSGIGNPTGATINSGGYVQNYLTDAKAQATGFGNFMTTALTDGQTAYVVETFFADPVLNFSSYPSGGLYSRTFF